jgi:hypothetical protein
VSFTDFKEVNINNPGTSAFYGADDLLEIMRILNGNVVASRQIKIKNPWVWQASFDIQAAPVTPSNPPANTKRMYVEPSNNHLMARSSAGSVVDFDVLSAGAQGEANTASNVGTAGVGVFKQKLSADLQFKKINAGSTKVTITDDTTASEVDIDVAEANLNINNTAGVLNVAKGGTGVNTIASNALLKGAGTSAVVPIVAGTNGHILTMVTGQPTWAAASASGDIKTAVFEAGTQIGTVGRRLNFVEPDDFLIVENTGADRFDITFIRAEVLVADWFTTGGITKANLGTTYADLFTTISAESNGADVDATGKNSFRLYVAWNKNAGSGTHSLQVISTVTTDVLGTVPTLVNGRNVVTGTIPAYFQDNVRTVKLQAKSTVSTDDPIFYNAHLYFK